MIIDLEEKLEGKIPVTREELFELVSSWGRQGDFYNSDNIYILKCKPKECYPLENLDISQITDLSYIFRTSNFNGDLSKWDLSSCKDMNRMFSFSEFRNNSIKDWNVSNVDNMEFLFYKSFYNGNLSKWDVSNVTNMSYMFYDSNFNNDSLKNWNVSNVKNIDFIFFSSKFNGNVSNWNVSNITIMRSAFDLCNFDGDISKWEFNKKVYCEDLFCDNYNFKKKYNSGKEIPHETKDFLEWFKENRLKIGNLNISNKEILDIDDYLSNFEIKEIYND